MISVIYLNYNRKVDLERSLSKIFLQQDADFEVIVVDQNSIDGSQEMIKGNFPQVNLFELKENLGVAGGRNFGASVAKGEYLVFIDDDAEFVSTDSLKKIELVFSNNSTINIIAFNINGHPERPEKFLFFSQQKDKFTNKYIGCGHAIRKEVFELLGGYTKELFFWGEEIEFAIKSYTIPKNRILFKGDIILFHRVSQVSRLKWKEGRLFYKVRNRLALSHKLLPAPVNYCYIVYYSSVYLIRAMQIGDIKSYFKGIREFHKVKVNNRNKLSFKQWLSYL